jgi:hypothetical protein
MIKRELKIGQSPKIVRLVRIPTQTTHLVVED